MLRSGKQHEGGLSQLEEELSAHCFNEALATTTSAAVANALSLVRDEAQYDDADVERMADELSDLAQLYGLSPDEVQQILFIHEPDLAEEF